MTRAPRPASPLRPPRLAAWLLRAFLPPDAAEPISGDLEELFRTTRVPRIGVRRARRWYWSQVAGVLCARLTWRPLRRFATVRRNRTMAALAQDVSYALRALRQQPGFAITAIVTLALGIGANLAIFSLVYAVLLKPLPFRDPGELMLVQMLSPDREAPGTFRPLIWSYPKYQIVRDQQRVFTATALFASREWSLTDTPNPERLEGEDVEATYFDVLGVSARLGRMFGASELGTSGANRTAVIGYGLWQRRFGADPQIVGKTIALDREPYTIIGVAPPDFRGLFGQADVWKPLSSVDAAELAEPFSHSYSQVARRRPGVSVEQAQAAVRVLGARINAQYPDDRAGVAWGANALPIDDQRVDPIVRRSVLVLLGAVGMVLLIGCVNLANLTLARGLSRQREVAIRLALGASRLRIVRQFLTESLVLSGAGTLVGALVAIGSIQLATAAMPDLRGILRGPSSGLTRVGAAMLGIDLTMAGVAVGLALVTAVLFGLVPAWQAARRDLTSAIKTGSAGSVSAGFRGLSLRNALIASEIALALVMLVASGLMIKSMMRLNQTDLGFRPDRLLTFRLALPDGQYPPERRPQFVEELLARFKQQPQIESAAYGHCAPISGGCNGTLAYFPGRAPVSRGREPMIGVTWSSPEYLSTLGIRLVRGRWFTDRDRPDSPKVVVINEVAARRFWKGEDPIGKRMGLGQGGFRDGAEVIGIVGDVRYRTVETEPRPDAYISVLQSTRGSGLVFVKSHVPPSTLVPILRRELAAVDPNLPMSDVKTMADRYGEATWRTWIVGTLLGLFAGLALVLAMVGIFGVLAQSVAQRTREIGVRMALGAERGDILRMVLTRAAAVAACGVAVGLAASYFSMRLLTTLLFDVRPDDPAVLGTLALVLLAVALLASYVPARRATRVDPLETLRSE